MAIYHSRIKTFSRAKGDSSVAAAAYRAGLLLVDHLTGRRHDYRHRGGVVESICLAPAGSPDWAFVPSELWPAAELAENRKNSTVAREFEVALPHELDEEQRSELTAAIAEALIARYGFAIQASIHSPGTRDGLNHHAHILATTRRVTNEGLGEKTRELDGGASGKVEVEWVRATIAELTNAHLAAAGISVRVDHRRLEIQAEDALSRGDVASAIALSRAPTRHLGKNATALERRGVQTDLGMVNHQIIEENEESLESLIQAAKRQGRAVATPLNRNAADEHSSRKRSSRTYRPTSGLQIEGLVGMRAGDLGLVEGRGAPEPPRAAASIEQMVEEAALQLRDVRELSPSLSLDKTHRLVRYWEENVSSLIDCPALRRYLQSVIDRLHQLRRGLTAFAKRLGALARAERLFHMAEQAWEQFNADCPRPTPEWMAQDWEARRGRRLSALDKRSTELKHAKAGTTDEARAVVEAEVLRRADVVEHRCSEILVELAMAHDIEGLEGDVPRPSGPAPATGKRPRPSL